MNKNYQKGYNFEHKVKKIFEENGFIATRSPASKTPIDIYAIGSEYNYLVQCKTTSKEKLYVYGLTDLMERASKINATPLLVYSLHYTSPYLFIVDSNKYKTCKEDDHLKLRNFLNNGYNK